jgi:hypothetical protein
MTVKLGAVGSRSIEGRCSDTHEPRIGHGLTNRFIVQCQRREHKSQVDCQSLLARLHIQTIGHKRQLAIPLQVAFSRGVAIIFSVVLSAARSYTGECYVPNAYNSTGRGPTRSTLRSAILHRRLRWGANGLNKVDNCSIVLDAAVRVTIAITPPPCQELHEEEAVTADFRRIPETKEKGYSSMHIFSRDGEVVAI